MNIKQVVEMEIKQVERTIDGELWLFDFPQTKQQCNELIEMAFDFGGHEFLINNMYVNINEQGITFKQLTQGKLVLVKQYIPKFWETLITTGEINVSENELNEFYNEFYKYL